MRRREERRGGERRGEEGGGEGRGGEERRGEERRGEERRREERRGGRVQEHIKMAFLTCSCSMYVGKTLLQQRVTYSGKL